MTRHSMPIGWGDESYERGRHHTVVSWCDDLFPGSRKSHWRCSCGDQAHGYETRIAAQIAGEGHVDRVRPDENT